MAPVGDIDLDFWRNPEGVAVPDDELRFLLVPDAVVSAAVDEVAQQVHAHQAMTAGSRAQVGVALIVTMGGMLPGVLLHDHLVKGRRPGMPRIEFGTVGVSLYKSPGVRHEQPRVQQEVSVPVTGSTVLLIDDLGDYGGTLAFLREHIHASGAHKVLSLVLYLKPAAKKSHCADFHFGETTQETWIITPRERVETLMKRVPVWKQRGASETECRRRLLEVIGYPHSVVDHYLPGAYAGG
jgi:hypoxanthine phosphoribosyltransferase